MRPAAAQRVAPAPSAQRAWGQARDTQSSKAASGGIYRHLDDAPAPAAAMPDAGRRVGWLQGTRGLREIQSER